MNEIARRFPGLSLQHVKELAAIVAVQRDAVAAVNQVFRSASWGLACLACQVVKDKIEMLHDAGTHPWLRYVNEAGMAYTVVVDDVPLRVQPDIDDIRDVMPGERAVMTQLGLLSEPDPSAVLRLEVAQRAGDPVETITLYLFSEGTGATLDSEIVYQRAAGNLLPLARPAEDVDLSKRFEFSESARVTANDNERLGDH